MDEKCVALHLLCFQKAVAVVATAFLEEIQLVENCWLLTSPQGMKPSFFVFSAASFPLLNKPSGAGCAKEPKQPPKDRKWKSRPFLPAETCPRYKR